MTAEALLRKLFLFVAFIGACILQPFVLMLVNEWHLQPLFGTPDIGWAQAYAIGLIPSLYNYSYLYKTEQKPMGDIILTSYIKYGLIVLMAWILQAV